MGLHVGLLQKPRFASETITRPQCKGTTNAELLCRCLRVSADEVVRAVRHDGLETVEQIRQQTGAATGCLACLVKLKAFVAQLTQKTYAHAALPTEKRP
jgi:NAD(P)H-nitrite reductase large subunit